MELEEMKTAWQELNNRVEKQQRFNFQMIQESKLTKARHSLRPLFLGQILQMIIGVLVIMLAVAYWSSNREVPHRLAAGIVVHVYGVLLIMLGGMMLGKMSGIDYAAPVLAIQKQLGQLRRFYIWCGMIVGLPWWLLWIAFAQVIFGLLGVDFFANAPVTVIVNIVVGVAGLLGTFIFLKWSHHPKRAGLANTLDNSAAGGSLNRAQKFIDCVADFEHE